MQYPSKRLALAAAVTASLALGGCWGDDDPDAPATPATGTAVPDSAGASASAFVSYVQSLDPNDDTSEPKTIGTAFAVPDDDASEPTTLPPGS
jgi:hypothetical protein